MITHGTTATHPKERNTGETRELAAAVSAVESETVAVATATTRKIDLMGALTTSAAASARSGRSSKGRILLKGGSVHEAWYRGGGTTS